VPYWRNLGGFTWRQDYSKIKPKNAFDEAEIIFQPLSEAEKEKFSKRLAKAEYSLVINDFRRYELSKHLTSTDVIETDLFGCISVNKVKRYLQSSLIWVFDLNEEPPRLSFDYVCDLLNRDKHAFLRCVAHALQDELVELIRLIHDTCGEKVAYRAAEKVGEFISIDRLIEAAK